MIRIDGSLGEGGGQILRTSLALSCITGLPFRIERIRHGRSRSGLLRQHLTAIAAAAQICNGEVDGNDMRSSVLTFHPGKVQGGEYQFSVGTAGSACLVLQTVLPALMLASSPSSISIEGGTHNPLAPPYDFLERSFFPIVQLLGPKISSRLIRPGFYPAGGGKLSIKIEPTEKLKPLELIERGEQKSFGARALVSNLPRSIGERELGIVRSEFGLDYKSARTQEAESDGPGNAVIIELGFSQFSAVFSAFGEKGRSAEMVAQGVVSEVKGYLGSKAVACPYLADQLLLPFAVAGQGRFTGTALTSHALTNIETIKRFLGVEIKTSESEHSVLFSL